MEICKMEGNFVVNPENLSDEDYKLWIHCNICYEHYVKKERRMYLFSCHHIFCENCIQKMKSWPGATPGIPTSFQCSKCSKIVKARQIGNSMPSHLKELFHPHPYKEDLPMAKILSFQDKHREHLIEGYVKLINKFNVLRTNHETEKRLFKKEYEEYRKLEQEGKRLGRRLRQIGAMLEQKKQRAKHPSKCPKNAAVGSTSDESNFLQLREPFGWDLAASKQNPDLCAASLRCRNTDGQSEVKSFIDKRDHSFNL